MATIIALVIAGCILLAGVFLAYQALFVSSTITLAVTSGCLIAIGLIAIVIIISES